MKLNNILDNASLTTKIAGGVFAILGLALLGIDYANTRDNDMIQLDENDVSVSNEEPIAKKSSD